MLINLIILSAFIKMIKFMKNYTREGRIVHPNILVLVKEEVLIQTTLLQKGILSSLFRVNLF